MDAFRNKSEPNTDDETQKAVSPCETPESPDYDAELIRSTYSMSEDYQDTQVDFVDSKIAGKTKEKLEEKTNTTNFIHKRKIPTGEDILASKLARIKQPRLQGLTEAADAEVSAISRSLKDDCLDPEYRPSAQELARAGGAVDGQPVRCSPRLRLRRVLSEPPSPTRAPLPTPARSTTPQPPRPSVEFVREIRPPQFPINSPLSLLPTIILEVSDENLDSQNIHLQLSPSSDERKLNNLISDGSNRKVGTSFSDPVLPKAGRQAEMRPDYIPQPSSLQNGHTSPIKAITPQQNGDEARTETNQNQENTAEDTTDSVGSIVLESPDSVRPKRCPLVARVQSQNASTPTEASQQIDTITPDSVQQKPSSRKVSLHTTTTPSTISPAERRAGPVAGTERPAFEIYTGYDEEGELQSLHVARVDGGGGGGGAGAGGDYQRWWRRATLDYLADVSKSTSPSSVASSSAPAPPPPSALPPRVSYASVASSSSGSSRSSDGNFLVPPPPSRTISAPLLAYGYRDLLAKLHDILASQPNSSLCEPPAAAPAGDAAPRPARCDTATASTQVSPGLLTPATPAPLVEARTPRSSLKKRAARGRRPLAHTTRRAILPTQVEEQEPTVTSTSPTISASNVDTTKDPDTERASAPNETEGEVVLGRWIDKRWYSGRAVGGEVNGRQVVRFDDGQSKALASDGIIWGEGGALPLVGQAVWARLREGQYAPALVLRRDTAGYVLAADGSGEQAVLPRDMYLTEAQARAVRAACGQAGAAPAPLPRNPALNLDNVLWGPRSPRTPRSPRSPRTPRTPRAPPTPATPPSPKPSTSGVQGPPTLEASRHRQLSESSEVSEASDAAGAAGGSPLLGGLAPEMPSAPRRPMARPAQVKGGRRGGAGGKAAPACHSLEKAPPALFAGLNFVLTCAPAPASPRRADSDATTDCEDLEFTRRPYNKEVLRAQLESGGGCVWEARAAETALRGSADTHAWRVIAARPCATRAYLWAVSTGVRALTHEWVAQSCASSQLQDEDAYALPAGYSLLAHAFMPLSGVIDGLGKALAGVAVGVCGGDAWAEWWAGMVRTLGGEARAWAPGVSANDILGEGTRAVRCVLWEGEAEGEAVAVLALRRDIPLATPAWLLHCLLHAAHLPPDQHPDFIMPPPTHHSPT